MYIMKSNVKNSIDSAIGKVFKSYRKKYHLTQTQVADKLGIQKNIISEIENGNSGVKLETLIKLHEHFRHSTWCFI